METKDWLDTQIKMIRTEFKWMGKGEFKRYTQNHLKGFTPKYVSRVLSKEIKNMYVIESLSIRANEIRAIRQQITKRLS